MPLSSKICLSIVLVIFLLKRAETLLYASIDENGYIVYCPCMGRFGNQAEQLLGSLLFAIHLNRTLVLPPFIEYNKHKVNFSPFVKYFKIQPLHEVHRVISLENFMDDLAPKVWPKEERFIFCYTARGSEQNHPDCNPFEGNPFKPFWHHFNITKFAKSVFHSPLVTQFTQAKKWRKTYKDIKVLAFVGAPSGFPTNRNAIPLQGYLNFSDYVVEISRKFRKERGFSKKPYLAVHLRHGSDWAKACDLLKESDMSELFSSSQCTQQLNNDETKLPFELCLHSISTIVRDIKTALKDAENVGNLQTIYIATDFDDTSVWDVLSQNFPQYLLITPTATYSNRSMIRKGLPSPHFIIDTYLLSFADYFIGNCISSFSAFASRLRIYSNNFDKTTQFFAFDSLKRYSKDEL